MLARSSCGVVALGCALGCGNQADPARPAPDAGPAPASAQTFGALEPWARPIDDYLAVGEREYPGQFSRDVNELAPHGGRLYLGYGDGTVNLGEKTAIEFRYFVSAADPAARAALVLGEGQGAPQVTPTASGEEQIDRFRVLDGELWQAGVDSTDPDELWTQDHTDPRGIQGNCYRAVDGAIEKHRSITGGEHVQDLEYWRGAVYGVGSGADTRVEFEGGQIFRYLWRTTDAGATFDTVERIQHPTPGAGDTRWVHLLPSAGALYLFGYESDFFLGTATVANARYDGSSVTALGAGDALARVFPDGTLALPDGSALLYGSDLDARKSHTWRVAGDGALTPLAVLEGRTVLDVSLAPDTSELVVLSYLGDDSDAQPTAGFDLQIHAAPLATPEVLALLATWTSDVRPRAVAYFDGALFVGTADGDVLRALPAP